MSALPPPQLSMAARIALLVAAFFAFLAISMLFPACTDEGNCARACGDRGHTFKHDSAAFKLDIRCECGGKP